MKIKKFVIRILKRGCSLMNTLIPKNSKKIVFLSIPDYTGNSKAFYEYIKKNHNNYSTYWLVKPTFHRKKSNFVNKNNILAIYHYMTSKYIVSTHNEMVGIAGKNQIYISLWHGMPFKKICYLGDIDHIGMEDYSAKRICTSEIMRSIISASFHEKANNVYVTGQPRNDLLYEEYPIRNIINDIPENKKIIYYIPTFRENMNNHKYSDGERIKDNNFLRVIDFDINLIDEFLEKINCILILKLHPYEEEYFKDIQALSKNIFNLKSSSLSEKNVDINQILSQSECLITDYSSVYFDYLILNKPIIFLTPDIKTYRKKRGGFTLEPFDQWTPGKKVTSQTELLIELSYLFVENRDNYKEKRNSINNIINKYQDNNNSWRVYEKFFK
ncbi:CDP-glycerol glycerophosphotransferase family protein [Proteus mirabilis]|uniref:CDP-glycerol glycerophosphotransferase family protein n=3 Tax=Proteus mirabilis TaxID=584 RepID=UPI000F5BCACD|nr:CDP-glycerol glycerophosphotransferase family protein [Proteus mirabilis]ELA7739835.1 CDP-glycerol glycerophosphotransferase family protein [Proteus mirabilis]MBC6385500.1 hypothetical protein [Proteus mirabilis]MBG2905104.1 CDP-glycerol glycerophosphotransferase family protein [Proteus mirabilis]MBI6246683.1 CDP-glycerol glycerophosphotransferase family protein [Proteus mirabilis]MBS3834700.1 CDP-glycerol glycerophosphotransferase family protein [Proteus mirabilis]